MTTIWLTQAQADWLVQLANEAAPREMCGLLAGTGSQVKEVLPISNTAADPQHMYYLDERAFAQALTKLEARGLSLLAFYHSHPSGDPVPSVVDVQQAFYPDTPYLIVGLRRQARLAAWLLRYGQAIPVTVHIGFDPPEEPARMTQAQKAAVLLSALIAFVLLIVLSLSLLPPAPPIP